MLKIYEVHYITKDNKGLKVIIQSESKVKAENFVVSNVLKESEKLNYTEEYNDVYYNKGFNKF